MHSIANLVCPIRGQLKATHFAADGLTVTEEARRIDCINFILSRNYQREYIECETTIIRNIGNQGRNSLRADIVVYDIPIAEVKDLIEENRNRHILLVAEIKRESKSKKGAITFQLEPALRQIDRIFAYGVYWDDINRHLYIKQIKDNATEIIKDDLGNLPICGNAYKYKQLKYADLIKPEDISATLMDIANVLRSNGINDEGIRYKETVKLLLAKYIDEREGKESNTDLVLQVVPGTDSAFIKRVSELYKRTARIYSKAKSIFTNDASELSEKTLKEIVKKVQGLNLYDSSSDAMQQVFMTFVPAVFKKDLDQYFTPLTLVNCMVEVLKPGPNDKVADPAMGTADFLTATMQYRFKFNDGQIINRVYGVDKDSQAYELAVINMILNKDGQTNLHNYDSIEKHDLWQGQMDVALCNPPFGSKTIESRKSILQHYDLGHLWVFDEELGNWIMTDQLLESQQLGILFIERCFKLLADGGRMGIILPEGYLCTQSYGYVRQWIINNLKIIGLVELPRRIFLKSEADLRSNILFCRKERCIVDYPIHTELVRKVGYKLGKGFFTIPARDDETGLEIRDEMNQIIIDTDFRRVKNNLIKFIDIQIGDDMNWNGAFVSDITKHPYLDMKPRRLNYRALDNLKRIKSGLYAKLSDIADVVGDTTSFADALSPSEYMFLVEGQDIRAVEGIVVLKDHEKRWQVEVRKTSKGYKIYNKDIVIGLVRPERRNVGIYIHDKENVYGSPDGVAVIRQKKGCEDKYPIEWIFHALRTEDSRIQFWTESGGTSYGKLTLDHIRDVLIPIPAKEERDAVKTKVKEWYGAITEAHDAYSMIWTASDRKTILNSPLIGLEADEIPLGVEDIGDSVSA